jgi:hypothetical protein
LNTTPKILVATPMYNSVCLGTYVKSITDLFLKCNDLSWKIDLITLLNESLVTRARNTLVNGFLMSDFTHLLFIDADVSFNPQDVIEMVNADKPIIGGMYPQKRLDWFSIENAVKNNVPTEKLKRYTSTYNFYSENQLPISGERILREVTHMGTGYMLIQREVFEKLSEKVPEYYTGDGEIFFGKKEPEKTKEFFTTSIDETYGVLLSEDYDFCKKWISLGEKLYIAEWAYGFHSGTYVFG